MKRMLKIFGVLIVVVIALFSFSIVASATEVSNTQDGLVASINSEKDSYKANEDIELIFKVTNTNDFAVENVSLQAIIPEGLKLKSENDTKIDTVSLASGESLELTLTVVKESSAIVVPIETTLSTENTTETSAKEVVEIETVKTTSAKANSSTSNSNSKATNSSTVKTGRCMSYVFVALICIVCAVAIFISFRFKKKAVKYLSIVLCVCIAISSVALVIAKNTWAQKTVAEESDATTSFKVSKNITIDGKDYTFVARIKYEIETDIILTDFQADTFDIYLNEKKDVIFTCKVNSNISIGEEDVAVYDDIKFIAYMNDNGINGDTVANDGVYSAKATLSSSEFALVEYYATAFGSNSNIFEINFYRDLTPEEFASFNKLNTNISNLSFDKARKYVEQSEEIDSYFIDEVNKIITYTTKYHVTGVWEEEKDSSFKGSGELSIPTSDGRDYENAGKIVNKYRFTSDLKKKDVVVLRPFRNTEFLYDDFKYTGELLSNALNSDVVIKDDENVTLSYMKTLYNYGIVLIDSHGILVKGKTPHIVIGEKYKENNSYSADYSSGRICVTSKKNLTIGSQFIKTYYQSKSLTNTFLFLGTCYSGYLNDIPSSLSGLGAEAVIGFSDTVSVSYCNNSLFEMIINSMILSSDTLENGVEFTKKTYGNYDPYNPKCELTEQGNISYRIANEIEEVLYGSVIESGTNEYLSNVRIDAYLETETGVKYFDTMYADDKGNFSMALQNGSYELRFNKDGYKTTSMTITVSKNVMTVLKDPVVMEKEVSHNIEELGALIKKEASTNNGNITLKLWVPEDSLELTKKQVSELKNLFKEYADIQIEVVANSKSDAVAMVINDKYSSADVFYFEGQSAHKLLLRGDLAKVIFSEEVTSMNTSESVSVVLDDNQLLAYPLTSTQTYILCYNKSIILDNDIKSLENIMSACKESNKKFGIDASNAFANSMFLFTGGLEPMGFENDGFTQKFNNYNIDEVASSVYAFANLFKKYEPYFENNSSDNLVKQLDNGTVAAGFIGSWDISKAQAALGENAGFAILPTINIDGKDTQIKCFYEYDYLGVNSSSDFPVSSQILAYYLSNSNSQQARAEKLNFSPTNINVIDSNYVKGHPALTSIVNQSYSSINFNAISYTFWDPCEQEIGEYITDFNNDFSYNAIKLQVQNTITNILDE